VKEKISTSHDLPLSSECKRIFAYAAEESMRLFHGHIGIEHLLLGILREEKCVAAEILRGHGLDLTSAREALAKRAAEPASDEPGVRTMLSAVPVLQVTNVARSIEWYQRVLEFSADPFGDPADPSFASLAKDGVEIMLQKRGREPGGPPSVTKADSGWDAHPNP
jgi:hypothetical protein